MSAKCECITCKQGNEEKFTKIADNAVECDYCGNWMVKDKDGYREPTVEEITDIVAAEYVKKNGFQKQKKKRKK